MATLTVSKNPGARLDAGAAVVAAGKRLDSKLVKPHLLAFAKLHTEYAAAEAKVVAADAAVSAQQAVVGARDAAQDAAVDALATALAGDGFARANPFKALGFAAPSTLKVRPVESEASQARQLAAAAAKAEGASAATKARAKALTQAAADVEKAVAPLAKLKATRAAAIAERDVLGLRWEKALATLRRFAQADDGDAYATLFRATAQRTAKRSAKKPAKPGATPKAGASKPATAATGAS